MKPVSGVTALDEDGREMADRYDYWSFAKGYTRFMEQYRNAVEPVPTTIKPLDDLLKGGFRPGVHFIGGNTGAGKTAFCLYLMEKMASCIDPETGQKTGCTFISLELTDWEVRARLGSRLSYASDSLQAYSWSEFETFGANMRRAGEGYEWWNDPVSAADIALTVHCPNMRVIDAVSTPQAANLTYIEQEILSCGAHGGRVCFIDYLQCIEVGIGIDEQEAMKMAVRSLNLAGMRAGVAVIVIAAVNRAKGAEMRKGKRGENPGSDVFRGSSWIEYTGLSAFALVRRDGADADELKMPTYATVELYPVKNRRGECGEPVILGYNGRYGDFKYQEGTRWKG